MERLNEIFDDANFQGNSVKGSMYGRLEAAEKRLAERKAEKGYVGGGYESAEERAVHPSPIERSVLRHEARVKRGEVIEEEVVAAPKRATRGMVADRAASTQGVQDRADLRAIASEPETMSEADEVAEMMQQLQALIQAKK